MVNDASDTKRTVLVLDADTLGRGDDALGRSLMVNFLRAMAFRDEVPETVVCYNSGAKLAESGSPAIPMLEALAHKGAEIVVCGTCVEHFRLRERIAVGRVGDMRGIVEALARADRIISV